MKEFDVLNPNQPIFQNTLIEASAGTGKTFSIENIVLRMLTEAHPKLNRPLRIEEILVVTFTKAATKDLLGRIRSNLEKGLAKNLNPIDKKRIELALFCFDEAKVFTIHKFAAKELTDAGFIEMENEENTVSNESILQVIRDFFRTETNRFHEAEFEALLREYPYEKLEKELLLRVLNGKRMVSLGSFQDREALFKKISFDKEHFIDELKKIAPSFQGVCNRQGEVKSLKEIEKFVEAFDSEEGFIFCLKDQLKWLSLFTEEKRNKNKPITQVINELYSLKESLTPLISPLTIFANVSNGILDLLEKKLEKEEALRFDDLLKKMLEKCQLRSFREKIREKYLVAIVDEFQDTDSTQWQIFKTLFLDSKNHTLVLVGDPKQAIYAFRGADVYTYLEASKMIENHAHLMTNFRSETGLIDALNLLFLQKNLIDLPKWEEKIPYTPVKASSTIKGFNFQDGLKSVQIMMPEEDDLTLEEAESTYFFPYIANQLISLNKQGIPFEKCALLVADKYQGERCKAFLKKANIKSQVKREKPLAETEGYKAVTLLLKAIDEIRDESLLKQVLGGPFFRLSDLKIQDIPAEALSQLYHLRNTLLEEGVFPFFDTLLDKTRIAFLSEEGGDNFLEEIELLEQFLTKYSLEQNGWPKTLLRGLQELALQNAEQERLPSKDSVKISTIHSSKGLEYDIVFSLGTIKKMKVNEEFVPKKNSPLLTPSFDKESLELFVREFRAEQLRLLYVAWTRAKFRLYIPYLKTKNVKDPSSMDLFCEAEDILSLNNPNIEIRRLTKEPIAHYTEKTNNFSLLKPKEKPFILQSKPVVSFTSLTKQNEFIKEINPPKKFDAAKKTRHTLPAGIETGLLLHHILETFPLTTEISHLKNHIASKINNTVFASWSEVIEEICIPLWVKPFIGGCVLGELKHCFREIPFLNYGEKEMTKGVIDLMFPFEGKLYLVDWKSNWLGEDELSYREPHLEKAITPYLLQKQLYEKGIAPYLALFPSYRFEGTFIHFLRGGKTKCL